MPGIDPFTGIPLPPDPPAPSDITTGTPISDLPLAAALIGDEWAPILQQGETVKVQVSQFGGGGGGGDVTNPIQPVGAGSIFAVPPVTVTAALTLIAAARTGAPGVGRVNLTIQNNGIAAIAIGDNTITPTTGWPLAPGEAITIPTTAAIYGITNNGSIPVAALETF